jgi:hypothetical protein
MSAKLASDDPAGFGILAKQRHTVEIITGEKEEEEISHLKAEVQCTVCRSTRGKKSGASPYQVVKTKATSSSL